MERVAEGKTNWKPPPTAHLGPRNESAKDIRFWLDFVHSLQREDGGTSGSQILIADLGLSRFKGVWTELCEGQLQIA